MIYFDNNKQAYGQEIEDLLCAVEDEVWNEFATLTLGVEYDITSDGIIDLRQTDEYKAEQAQKERERLNHLSLTAADVERAIYKNKGIDFDDIIELVKANPQIDVKALKIEFKANNFFRGNPYIDQIGTILGYTSDDLDYLFQNKELPLGAESENTSEE